MSSTQIRDRFDDATEAARQGLQDSRSAAHRGIDRLADTAGRWQEQAAPAMERVSERASDLARQSSQWVRDSGQRMRRQVVRASDRTVGYVRDEPVRSVMIAAAAGALLFALVRMLGSRRED